MKIFQISAGFLLFPVTYQVEAESRKRRAAPEAAGPGSEAGLGLALRSIQGLVARLDCVEVSASKSSRHYAKQTLTPRSLNVKLDGLVSVL